jgi:hypothetical protein
MHDYTLIFDGGSRGNPGPGYGSYQLTRVADGKQKTKRLEFGDHVTTMWPSIAPSSPGWRTRRP